MAADNARDRAASKAKREAEEARQKALQDQAEREKKGKGQQRARSPEPYRQKKQYSEPPPWRGAPQTGKGGKAPKPPKSPPPTEEVITINEQLFTPVERPSKNKQAPRRKLPPKLLEGKGQEAASGSSSVTVPVHDLQGKAKAEIKATYRDFALRTVLQNLVRVFDPKQKNQRVRDTSPMDQIAELVLTHDLDWTTVEGMLECAVDENAASTGRSDQSLSSRGRPEKRRTRRSKGPHPAVIVVQQLSIKRGAEAGE